MQRGGKINCNDNFEKIHRSKIENFITVTAMIFFKYCDDAMTFFYKKSRSKYFFIAVIKDSQKISDE